MHKKQSRKKELTKRIFVYSLMTATMLLLLIVLTYRILGYQFNFSTRSVEQTGLVQYDSFPRGAVAQADGRKIDNTRTKSSELPGVHQFSMSLSGYHDWQKTLNIKAGIVTWLSYARLVPVEKNIVDTGGLGHLINAKSSPDSKFIYGVRQSTNSIGKELVLIDIRDSKQPKITAQELPQDQIGGITPGQNSEHSLKVAAWDESSRHILLKHDFLSGDKAVNEWLWVDRENQQKIVNISSLTNLEITDIKTARDGQMYILQSNGDVRLLTVDSGAISRPLISQVTSFNSYQDNILSYNGTQADNRVVGVWRDGWTMPTIMQIKPNIETSVSTHIAVSNYFYNDTVAISNGSNVVVYSGKLPQTTHDKDTFIKEPFATFTLSRPIEKLSISQNGRFIIAEDDNGFVSYDLELKTVSQQVKKYLPNDVEWIDQYHISQIDSSGMLVMQEFDGFNSHELMLASGDFPVVLTHDSRYIYAVVQKDDGSSSLQRFSMTKE